MAKRKRARWIPLWVQLALLLAAGALATIAGLRWLLGPVPLRFDVDELERIAPAARPLLDLIALGEGDYTSVNRGRAGDSPGDWPAAHLDKSITQMSLRELRSHQGGEEERCWLEGKRGQANLYAVGRYQLIPCTLQLVLKKVDGIDMNRLYDHGTQDALAMYLVLVKRRRLGAYLLGRSDDFETAGQELAREFASVPIQVPNARCDRGQSYYCGDKAGNAAHISLDAVSVALPAARDLITSDVAWMQEIESKEGFRGRLRRAFLSRACPDETRDATCRRVLGLVRGQAGKRTGGPPGE